MSNDANFSGPDTKLDAILTELEALRGQVGELEEKLHTVISEWTRNREDLTGAADETNRGLAMELDSFISQRLVPLALSSHARPEGEARSSKRTAQLVSTLCKCYLGPSGIDLTRARKALKARRDTSVWTDSGRIAIQAKRILESAKALQIDFVWDYDCESGFPIDDFFQASWSTCDPAGDIEFVVTPAYLADGEYYLKQKVFTRAGADNGRARD